jgi:hypothetical protein
VIGLLRVIRNCMYGGLTTKRLEHTLINAQTKLFNFCQTSRMANAEYLQSFCGLVDVIEFLGGDIGVDYSCVEAYLEPLQ